LICLHAGCGSARRWSSLNRYLDRHGILDADYERAAALGHGSWVLRADRDLTPWPGRHLVVVDSLATQRPDWAPAPTARSQTSPSIPGHASALLSPFDTDSIC
jgi:hypothetical protein